MFVPEWQRSALCFPGGCRLFSSCFQMLVFSQQSADFSQPGWDRVHPSTSLTPLGCFPPPGPQKCYKNKRRVVDRTVWLSFGEFWKENAQHIQPSTLDQWTPSEGDGHLPLSSYALLLSPECRGGNGSVREGHLHLNKCMTAISALNIQSLKTAS